MKQVIVLADDELQKSRLLHRDFGTINHNAMLCVARQPNIEKVFTFQTFGLSVNDKKMDEYMQSKDGIAIIINPQKLGRENMSRIVYIISTNTHTPILLFFDYNDIDNKFGYHSDDKIKALLGKLGSILDSYAEKYLNFKYFVNSFEASSWFNDAVKKFNPNKKEIKLTSVTIDPTTMAQQFENATLPLHIWDHYGRLRIVHYSIMKYGYNNTIDPNGWLCKHWRAYKTTIGHGDLWHYSLTRFWVDIINNLQLKNNYKSFDDLYKSNPPIQNGSFFKNFYSDEVIFTTKARNEWIKPDKIK